MRIDVLVLAVAAALAAPAASAQDADRAPGAQPPVEAVRGGPGGRHGHAQHGAAGTAAEDHASADHSKMDHSKMDHSKMDHSKMDHSKMDHSKMDHSKMDHSKMDHSKMDHSKMDHSKMDHSKMDHSKMDHSKMDHSKMDHSKMDHSKMDHSKMDHSKMDHSKMDHSKMDHSKMDHSKMDHSKMDHSKMDHSSGPQAPRTPIPAVTDADRAAAFPADVHGHDLHGDRAFSYVLIDRLEGFDAEPGAGQAWEAQAWIGGDVDRLWLRSEGERVRNRLESADLELLWGHGITPWWDVVAGLRHDFAPGDSRTYAAIGVQGLAPQKFEVSATAYLGERGRTAARVEAEYEVLLTNRLVLQPRLEAEWRFGRDEAPRRTGSGLATAEAGLRLRYEFTRQFAPYVGVVHERAFGETARHRLESGGARETRFVVGLRTWF